METTLTQRDKALLLILGIILIIFAAVMIPKVGIYALISTRSETATTIATQKSENETLYMELVQSGVNGAYVESGAMAKKYLETKLLNEKHDIARLSTSICRQDSYDTAKNWIYTMKYKGYVIGETAYFDSLNVVPKSVVTTDGLTMFDITYDVKKLEADVEIVLSTETKFNFDLQYCTNLDTLNDLATMLVMASQTMRRGSCMVSEFVYNKSSLEEGQDTITLTVVVYTPANNAYSGYASEICECHHCGYAYTLEWYKTQIENASIEGGEATVSCPSCSELLDGTTIG